MIANFDYDPKYWDLSDLQAALNSAFSELGDARLLPEDSPDRVFMEAYLKDAIERVDSEMRRRLRGGQDLAAARVEAGRYPPELIGRVKAAYDLRDHIARDLGMTKPISGKICSPFREDHTPSFHVYADHFFDFGTQESGDILDWRMRRHGISWWEAVESLAIEAGIPLPASAPAAPRSTARYTMRVGSRG